jgi:hypothetical protein
MGLERGPLTLVRITEELLERKSSGSGSRKPKLTAVEVARSVYFACRLKPRNLVYVFHVTILLANITRMFVPSYLCSADHTSY